MPLIDDGKLRREIPRYFEAAREERDRLMYGDWMPRRPSPAAIGPAEVLAAVRGMDAGQRGELARLLGVEARHPLLYLPSDAGGYLAPAVAFNPTGEGS
jgi:hypothetical protein